MADFELDEFTALQQQLTLIQQAMARQGQGAVLVLEGMDTAGKGGLIKRLSWCLDPRWFHVHPTSAPSAEQQQQHWQQRFWQQIPAKGHIGVFDRSWYGRVLVERVEHFASPEQVQRGYRQINDFEASLQEEGFQLLKIWLDITADTQLHRLQERLADPQKRWKLTSEDIRNRQKWQAYQQAKTDMIQQTSTPTAPWHMIDANKKASMRLAVFQLLVDSWSKGLDVTIPSAPAEVEHYLRSPHTAV